MLDEELDQLPEKYRLPIILFHLEDRSQEEVAPLLETTQTAALAKGAINMLTITKLKIAAAIVATAAVVTTTGVVVVQSVAQAGVAKQLPAGVLPKKEMPVYVLWSHDRFLKGQQRMALTWPLATVARQPKLDAATTDAFSGNGKLELHPAADQSGTVVVMVSPPLDIGKFWRPARVLRDDGNITIVVEPWSDNEGRPQNIRRQSLYVVSLGQLDAGEYTFELQVRDMFLDVGQKAATPHYQERAVQSASTTLRVLQGETDVDARPVVIQADALQSSEGNRLAYQVVVDPWQPVAGGPAMPLIHSLDARDIDGVPAPGVRVGTADLAGFSARPPKKIAEIPTLAPPSLGDPVYVTLIGPPLNIGEKMQLREIRWVDRKAILCVDVWRDGEGRRRNIPYLPLLLAPLKEGFGPIGQAGNYEIEVQWSLLFAPDLKDGLYTRYSPEQVGDAPVPVPMKNSFLAVAKTANHAEFEIAVTK